jgi:hypothetical protein
MVIDIFLNLFSRNYQVISANKRKENPITEEIHRYDGKSCFSDSPFIVYFALQLKKKIAQKILFR